MSEYKYDFVKVRLADGIAWTSLNRPEKRNAMSPALHYDMDDALARLEVDDAVEARAEARDPCALTFEAGARAEHGLVLDARRDDAGE